jgi:hypothetical protein
MPNIPHRGIMMVATLVTTNLRVGKNFMAVYREEKGRRTMVFVLIFQYFWMYQNPNVLKIHSRINIFSMDRQMQTCIEKTYRMG